MEKEFKNRLEELLMNNGYSDNEDKYLNKQKVLQDTLTYDHNLINLLLSNEEMKKEFFVSLDNNVNIFKIDNFKSFISDYNFLSNSYTSFKNKIGFSTKRRIDEDTVLTFPYKDCILQGGMTTEDQKTKQEIFYNKVLARDEITKLLEPKVLKNIKKITGENKEENLTEFTLDDQGNIKDNLLIKGNNLLALHTIKQNFAGKVKLIYIDPPYNTGNDSFNYNDRFNHSTWLTFMKNRLEIAKELLSDDGVVFVQIDDNEQAYLKVLMDEIFGKDNFVNTITLEMSSSGGTKAAHKHKKIPTVADYLHVYKKNDIPYANPLYDEIAQYDSHFSIFYNNDTLNTLTSMVEEINWNDPNFQQFIYNNINSIYQPRSIGNTRPDNLNKVTSIKDTNIYIDDKNNLYKEHNNIIVRLEPLTVKYKNGVLSTLRGNIWKNIHKSMGNINKEGSITFGKGKKTEFLIKDIINLATKPNDIVLDFFAGSGTTGAVAHKMSRQWITIEQMDYIEDITKKRISKVIDGEQGGISKTLNSQGKGNLVYKDIAKERLSQVMDGEQGGISKALNWQGGGDFVYMELSTYNQEYIKAIEKATTNQNLIEIYNKMKGSNGAFLNYNVDIKIIENNIVDMINLEFKELQTLLLDFLNLNMLYQPITMLDDEQFNISTNEKKLNKQFHKTLLEQQKQIHNL